MLLLTSIKTGKYQYGVREYFSLQTGNEHTRTICSVQEIESLCKVRKENVLFCVPEIESLIVLKGKVNVTLKQKKEKEVEKRKCL
jgi:hypothetical protein